MLLLQASANQETKSSAGDKYETGRAMAQQEIDMARQQIHQTEKLLAVLQNIVERKSIVAIPGSLVTTSGGIFYLAISIGKITHGSSDYFIVSADSPIGSLLMGKRSGDRFTRNGNEYIVHSIE